MNIVLEKESQNIINKFIEKELNLVEERLKLTSSKDEIVSNISRYLFERKGKRIRAKLLLLSYFACRDNFEMISELNDVVNITAVVEMLHTASLIHDDVIDSSNIRRGRETVNSRWGNKISTLMGDYLYSRAASIMSDVGNNDVLKVITEATGLMCEGEIAQVNSSFKTDITEDRYIDIIFKKTASLFGAACESGAILAKASSKHQTTLKIFGVNLGIAFQIIDDIMDVVSNNGNIGKPVGSDLKEGKITLPYIYVFNNGNDNDKKVIADCMGENDGFKKVESILEEYKAIDYAKNKAISYIEIAKNKLNEMQDSLAKNELVKISDFIINRTY